MKNFYLLIVCFFIVATASAQCVIDSTNVPTPGVYPAASNLPHIQQGVFYDQTVQGRIQSGMDTSLFGGIVAVHMRIDSVRIDSITGMPAGINWFKSPNVLRGGGAGCVDFKGTTSASGGNYPLTAWGVAWTRAQASTPISIDTPYVYSGNLNNFSPFGGYYLVVDGGSVLSATTTVINVSCFGSSTGRVTANPSGGSNYTYNWSNGGNTAFIANVPAGTYTVTVTSGSASVTASATVTQPAVLTASATSTASSGSNGTATASASGGTAAYTYHWGGNQTTASITGLAPGTYNVTVTDNHGCTATATTTVVVSGIDEPEFESAVHIYPNPAKDVINVTADFHVSSKVTIRVTNLSGQLVYSTQQIASGKYTTTLNCEAFAPGVYVLELGTEKQMVRNRFVVAR